VQAKRQSLIAEPHTACGGLQARLRFVSRRPVTSHASVIRVTRWESIHAKLHRASTGAGSRSHDGRRSRRSISPAA
jgi:hypothetical protein